MCDWEYKDEDEYKDGDKRDKKEIEPFEDYVLATMETTIENMKEKTFDKIFGVDRTVILLKENSLLPFKSKPLLLFGVPGSGKTAIVCALANHLDCAKLHIFNLWNLQHYLFRDRPDKCIRTVFKIAMKEPSILCFDDLDVLEKNLEWFVRGKNSFIKELKEYLNSNTTSNFFIIGLTQQPWRVDPCIKKLFRMPRSSHLKLPRRDDRIHLLKSLCTPTESLSYSLSSDDYELLASKTQNYSGSDLICLVKSTSMQKISKLLKETHFEKISVTSSSPHSSPMPSTTSNKEISCSKIKYSGVTELEGSDAAQHLNSISCDEKGYACANQEKAKPEEMNFQEMYIPCKSSDAGSIPMSALDIPEDKFHVSDIVVQDFLDELSRTKATAIEDELQRMAAFELEFCY